MSRLSTHVIALAAILAIFSGCPVPPGGPAPADTTAPTGTILINNNDTYTTTAAVELSLAATDDHGSSGIQMLISNTTDFAGSTWESLATQRAWTLIPGDGPKTVYVKFKDAAGNESAAASDSISLNSMLPGAPGAPDLASADDTGTSNSDNITRQTTGLTFSGTGAPASSTITLRDSVRGVQGSGTADASGNWSLDVNLAEGTYSLSATARIATNESPSSPSLSLIVDTIPPAGTPGLLKPSQGLDTGVSTRPSFTWTGTADAAAYELQADSSSVFDSIEYDWADLAGTSFTPASDMSVSTVIPVGTRYYLRLRALDVAGNAGPWSNPGAKRYVNVGRFCKDFNGDGYSDVLASAYSYGGYQGRAYVYFGGPSMDNVADVTMTGEASMDMFGYCVASAGDVNGDGYADAIVGAYSKNSTQGKAYIYLGGPSMDNVADFTMTGETTSNSFAYSVATAGDVNGDGYGDVLIGAQSYSGSTGRAYVYYGGSPMDISADVTMTGDVAVGAFGCCVASAGDVNGDGFSDLIVGAQGLMSSPGKAYVFLGGAAMDSVADVTLAGEAAGNVFGQSVGPAGDVNGDGYADVIVGAYKYNGGQGKAYFYFGGPSMDNSSDLTMVGEGTADWFGGRVGAAGDVNRDGYDDMFVTADAYNSDQGREYIYLGSASMDGNADILLTGETGATYFGVSAATAGDVNADGYSDLVVGAFRYANVVGRAYVYNGGASMDDVADVTFTGASGDYYGRSVD